MNTCSQLPERAFASSLQRGVVDTTDGCSVSFSLCVRQAFVATRSGDGVWFAQAGSLQLDPVSTVHDAVQDRVANRRVADKFMPAANGDLAGDQQRALFVTVVDDFQQVASLLGGQWLRSPVVDYQQPGTFQARQQSGQPSLATRGGEFGEQSRRPPIQRREALTPRRSRERTHFCSLSGDPPGAHEFMIGLAAPSSDDCETICGNDANGVACGRFFVRRESVSSSRPTSESAARAAAVKGGEEQPAATRSAL